MAFRVAVVGVRAEDWTFDPENLTKLEWTIDVAEYGPKQSIWQNKIVFNQPANLIVTKINTKYDAFTPGNFGGLSNENISTVQDNLGYTWSEQFHLYTSLAKHGGVEMLSDVEAAATRQIAHVWTIIDPGFGNDGTSSSILSRAAMLADVPLRIRWRAEKVGEVTNPPGNLWRDGGTGTFDPLVGDFSVWDVSNEIDGAWHLIARYYLPEPEATARMDFPHSLVAESHYDDPSNPMVSQPTDARYSELRAYDGATGKWHDLLKWKTRLASNTGTDTNYGWAAHAEMGKVAYRTGYAGETANDRFLWCGLTYHRGDTLAALPFGAIEDVTAGTATYNGPHWRAAGGFPSVQQERNRGFHLLRPSATAAAVVLYPIRVTGIYTFTGSFARANTASGSGNGVTVSVASNDGTSYHSGSISQTHAVNPDSLFTGTGRSDFSFTTGVLSAGQNVLFSVDAIGESSFDATGLHLDPPSFIEAGISSLASGEDTGIYLLRYQRRGDGEWHHKIVRDASSTLIAPARIGTYDLQLYRLAANGLPSDPIRSVFEWEPDRDFEHTSVSDLMLVNYSEVDSATGTDPRREFTGPDVFLTCVEPDYSGETRESDPSDINSTIDPLVREFEWQTFDPATGTLLRSERILSRDYVYRRSDNSEDQAVAFGRGPQRELGFRVILHSVTNRTSAADHIVVSNPLPAVPSGATLTTTPGNSASGATAMIHATVEPGQSKSDGDFARFAAWASETPGFIPGPSTFKGVSGEGSNTISFPAPSGVTMYVRIGGLDQFHAAPELIAAPLAELNLLSELSIETIDGAVFPVDTEDITRKAVTDSFSAHGSLVALGGAGDAAFRTLLALNALPAGGIVAVKSDVMVGKGANKIAGTVRALRDSKFTAVKLWDNSAGVFLDFTDAAYSAAAGDVTLMGDTSDWLYIGTIVPLSSINESGPHIFVVITSSPGAGAIERQYWNGSTWASLSMFDGTSGLGSSGTLIVPTQFAPVDLTMTTVDGVTCFWYRFRRDTTPSGGATAARIYLRQILDSVTLPSSGTDSQEFITVPLAATIDPTELLEGVFAEANSTSGGSSNPQRVETTTLQLTVGKR